MTKTDNKTRLETSKKEVAEFLAGPAKKVMGMVEQNLNSAQTGVLSGLASNDEAWQDVIRFCTNARERVKNRQASFFEQKRALKLPAETHLKEIEAIFAPVKKVLDDIDAKAVQITRIGVGKQRDEQQAIHNAKVQEQQEEAARIAEDKRKAEERARTANNPVERHKAEQEASDLNSQSRLAESATHATIAQSPAQQAETIVDLGGRKVKSKQKITNYQITNPNLFLQFLVANYGEHMPPCLSIKKGEMMKLLRSMNGEVPGVVPEFTEKLSQTKEQIQ